MIRHLVKSISCRIIGTINIFLLVNILTGSIYFGLGILFSDFFSRLLLYYFHERISPFSKIRNANKRYFVKTFPWRAIESLTTLFVAWIVTSNPLTGFRIGLSETTTKIIL